ncbi:MAG: hypothetical protein COS85_23220 [Armatimonadetes bacterium CG07_land_8_20_14_0_80_59_28]|nr:MAG: hypothetical protein COS85_23220 [Armatimonadetes bacterium CG07_land_8_20_14_0_80_59_28]PIY39101.1 MAG: hypothetical protein COZ05_19715 [Armatimonadetes bacterium CG_4_10_14_3_um_filter_59_10]
MMTPPRLLVFDFDGTALGGHEPYAEFPEHFVRFLDGLEAHGIVWATNTTWSPDIQWELIRRSGVRSAPAFLTGQTGRVLAEVREGRLIPDPEYERHIAERDRLFRKRMWPAVRQVFMELLAGNLVSRLAFDYYSPQCGIDFTCNEGREEDVWRTVQPLLDLGEYYIFNPAQRQTGVLLPAHMNKGDIVRVMQQRLGIRPEETIVAGDGSNDLHMFSPDLCGWMVCPANAEPIVKERLSRHEGIVAEKQFSWGVVEAVEQVLAECEEMQQ